jgi:hypothetical protein
MLPWHTFFQPPYPHILSSAASVGYYRVSTGKQLESFRYSTCHFAVNKWKVKLWKVDIEAQIMRFLRFLLYVNKMFKIEMKVLQYEKDYSTEMQELKTLKYRCR